MSPLLIYNITEWSRFTKGTIYLGMENIQENNIRITSKTTYKKVEITFHAFQHVDFLIPEPSIAPH